LVLLLQGVEPLPKLVGDSDGGRPLHRRRPRRDDRGTGKVS
jgi:hypothetical protein